MRTKQEELKTVLVTDCGSTTTKALLFERCQDRWRQTFRGEAPTTVEAPVADVTVGALNAFSEVEELSGRKILSGKEEPFLLTESDSKVGIDLYLSTSSAGGGLQMLVAGAARKITTDSAERAALGAGAIVMEAISTDDAREEYQRIERIRELRPDIVLLTGGVDGGTVSHVVEMAETLVAASPRPRFGDSLSLPVVFAGNRDAAEDIIKLFVGRAQCVVVANVRPTLDTEQLGPAREAIHEFFLSHVMSHSPGYSKLVAWTPIAVMPTPAAVGDMVHRYGLETGLNILAVDIGGATTDLFSVFKTDQNEAVFHRTVSANLGMSYSIANVLVEAGAAAIKRWLPYEISDAELSDRLRNKMIRPTSIPQTLDDLWLEQAACREALRLSLRHHRSLATGLSGVKVERGISDIFGASTHELVDLKALNLVIGSGGVLSHAPNRLSCALMMLDGFELEGFTALAVDSVFMMPHLGVLASVYPEAAQEIFIGDCLVHLGYSIAPRYKEGLRQEAPLLKIIANGEIIAQLFAGSVVCCPISYECEIEIVPVAHSVDCGAGPGVPIIQRIKAGGIGIILDGRNRPIQPAPKQSWLQMQQATWDALGLSTTEKR